MMTTRLSAPRYFFINAAAFLLLLSVGATKTYASKTCPPSSPADIEIELQGAIDNLTTPTPIQCVANPNGPPPRGAQKYPNNGWDSWIDPTFNSWGTGGSLNLPVITAAVGLYRLPKDAVMRKSPPDYQISWVNWWVVFLSAQTGDAVPATYRYTQAPAGRGILSYYKGTEQFSNIYDASVVTSVIAVRYWAYRNGNTDLIRLTQKWLRANWAIDGMAAGTGPVWTYDLAPRLLSNGTTTPIRTPVYPPNKPVSSSQFNPYAPRRPGGGYFYNGHFLALAGPRSVILDGHWNEDGKATLFDRAIESVPSPLQLTENDNQSVILQHLENLWADPQQPWTVRPPANENLYGLNRTNDIPPIMTVINSSAQNTATQNAVSYLMSMMTFVRTSSIHRIIGWDGWRVSMMAYNVNGNRTNIYGIAYHGPTPSDPHQSTATFLYPWTDAKSGGADGWCRLEPPTAADPAHARLHASNQNSDPRKQPAGQPVKEAVMSVPADQPLFHLVLSPGSAPYLDTTPPTNWPPLAPKALPSPVFTPPDTAYGGDVSWVFNGVPEGGAISGDNEGWNWIDSNPNPYSEASWEHQSNFVVGWHQHFFSWPTDTLTVNAGESLYAYVYLDPTHPPSEVMLQWLEPGNGWEHRAFWGADNCNWVGALGTSSRYYMGPLPQPIGDWVRLEVPASIVDLEGRTLGGMAFSLFDGQATWGEAGKNIYGFSDSTMPPPPPTPTPPAYEGNHEVVDCNSVAGWVWDRNSPNTRLNVSVFDDTTGTLIASGVANLFRQDLANAGKGDGVHGFVIPTPTAIKDGQPHNVRVTVTGTNFSLGFTPKSFNSATAGCSVPPATDTVWIEDSIPAGATTVSGGWNWIGSNPTPVSGMSSHQSALMAGGQQHFFQGATSTLQVNVGDKLFTYVYLDPNNPPSEIMLQWFDPAAVGAEWEHRAYWGTNQIGLGIDGSNSRRYMGALPPVGQWVRIEVPASQVGLEGRSLSGMAFAQWDGRVTWDRSGKSAQSWLPPPSSGDTIWVEDSIPAGGVADSANEYWFWSNNNPAPASGSWSHQSSLVSGMHQHQFYGAANTLTLNTGDKLVAYVYLDPNNPPSEVMLQWFDPSTPGVEWEHRAYWGANQIAWGTNGQSTRYYMGTLPAAGQWIRLEVPARSVGIEGHTISGMAFTLFGGRATWDHAGKRP
jgi:hypothetical protein